MSDLRFSIEQESFSFPVSPHEHPDTRRGGIRQMPTATLTVGKARRECERCYGCGEGPIGRAWELSPCTCSSQEDELRRGLLRLLETKWFCTEDDAFYSTEELVDIQVCCYKITRRQIEIWPWEGMPMPSRRPKRGTFRAKSIDSLIIMASDKENRIPLVQVFFGGESKTWRILVMRNHKLSGSQWMR